MPGVLQIVTKMYFRTGVPLHSTVHRQVLYTNCDFLRSGVMELPVGELAPSTRIQPVSSVTLSVTEHLEAEYPDGRRSGHVATEGTGLVDDLADVLSFALNAVFSRDGDLVKRLVPYSLNESSRSSASKLFRRTFDASRFVPDAEVEDLRQFMTRLLALKRQHFEAAMRAIKRIVRATQRAVDDPTIAYVDLVAALESLSEGTAASAPTWEQLDARKRRLIDDALDGADSTVAERLREAVMEADRLGAKSRFVTFVRDSVSPGYFRTQAADAVRPIRGADLDRAVKLAYDVRSRNVHVLEDLPPEAWVIADRADTVSPPDMGTMLSHEGLARLARHVVRRYVDSAPTEIDRTFNWRASLPGQVRMHLAPQYWIWNAEGFDHKSVSRYFSGFVGHLADTFAGRNDGPPDIRAVLERIEQLLPGTADGPAKTFMVAIYTLWHRALVPSSHRPNAASLLARYEPLLQQADMPSFVVGLLSDPMPTWTDDQWYAMATDRRTRRSTRRYLELPAGFDAALQVMAAERLMEEGRVDEAHTLARFGVEELPGNEPLIAWESELLTGHISKLDMNALILGLEPGAGDSEEAPESGGDPAKPSGVSETDEYPPGEQPNAPASVSDDEHEAAEIDPTDISPSTVGEVEPHDGVRASGEQATAGDTQTSE